MSRTLWNGAITFGLVHIPVGLHPAVRDSGIDFDWLDARSMDPVGYKRVNKRTGREVERDDIVRAVKTDDDRYVVLSDDEIRAAYPRTTQTIEIETFVPAREIPLEYMDRPYWLAPGAKADKVYALLREALRARDRYGIARVVIQTKQHLAALVPFGRALMLVTLRWPEDIRSPDELELPPEGRKATGLSDAEMRMAAQLVDGMSDEWEPERYRDRFRAAIETLVERKARAGDATGVEPLEEAPAPDNVVDLTELLRRSLQGRRGGAANDEARDGADAAPKRRAASGPTRDGASSRAAPKKAGASATRAAAATTKRASRA
ncbi:MAG TPA: Ku protein, partial [Burkholderiaceae bacterium]|nr:Ku protein [Burkholderiaceae bacterium]